MWPRSNRRSPVHDAYPDTSETITPPQLTHEGRTTRLLRVGTRQADQVPGILLLGGIHAREWIPPAATISSQGLAGVSANERCVSSGPWPDWGRTSPRPAG
ncbi:M14 family zinc carboxypeptidase [Streptomyces sp. NPDC060027]|uniref:M14 family zinc carboxypeptidase n=1 Tax=Streptomyces sp. NPDC060027 TaxID=3347040 RepID=UPI0036C2B259